MVWGDDRGVERTMLKEVNTVYDYKEYTDSCPCPFCGVMFVGRWFVTHGRIKVEKRCTHFASIRKGWESAVVLFKE